MASKRCGALVSVRMVEKYCGFGADHAGKCAPPPTARERRLERLLERAQAFVDYVAGPASRKLSATIDRELARGKGVKRGK